MITPLTCLIAFLCKHCKMLVLHGNMSTYTSYGPQIACLTDLTAAKSNKTIMLTIFTCIKHNYVKMKWKINDLFISSGLRLTVKEMFQPASISFSEEVSITRSPYIWVRQKKTHGFEDLPSVVKSSQLPMQIITIYFMISASCYSAVLSLWFFGKRQQNQPGFNSNRCDNPLDSV